MTTKPKRKISIEILLICKINRSNSKNSTCNRRKKITFWNMLKWINPKQVSKCMQEKSTCKMSSTKYANMLRILRCRKILVITPSWTTTIRRRKKWMLFCRFSVKSITKRFLLSIIKLAMVSVEVLDTLAKLTLNSLTRSFWTQTAYLMKAWPSCWRECKVSITSRLSFIRITTSNSFLLAHWALF